MTAGVLCTAVPSRAGFDRRYSPAAQLLLGQARHQRIGLVESVELLDDLPSEAPKMPGRDENTRRPAAYHQVLRFEEDHLGQRLLRPAVEMDLGVVLQGTRGIEQRDRAVEARRRLEEARLCKRHAARDFTGLDTGQVQSGPLPCQGDVSGLVVDFN